jgi:hypothetical protein
MAAIGFSYGEKDNRSPLLASKFNGFTERLVVKVG